MNKSRVAPTLSNWFYLFLRSDLLKKERIYSPKEQSSFSKKGLFSEEAWFLFVCVKVLEPSQPNRIMSSVVSLPNNIFTG